MERPCVVLRISAKQRIWLLLGMVAMIPILSGCIEPTPFPDIYSQGELTVGGTCLCDLDEGRSSSYGNPLPEGTQDFWWEQVDLVVRYLVPTNNAVFANQGFIDFENVTYNDLLAAQYSSENINGSNNDSNQIPFGTVLFYKTSSGRYGKLEIQVYGYSLTIIWVTYE